MKKIVFNLLPEKLKRYILGVRGYHEDISRYNKFVMSKNLSHSRIVSRLILKYHVMEKGLTMSEMKPGFGKQVVLDLLNLCDSYILKNYDTSDVHFIQSVKVLNEYVRVHGEINYALDSELVKRVLELSQRTDISLPGSQLMITKDAYFEYSKSEFKDFCLSRHSVRSFSDENVEIQKIKDAIFLAQKSPSSCNRQPNRVYIINNKEVVDKVLAAQKGNRGFGHSINKVLILTAEVSVFSGYGERNEAFINSGLFAMGLLYGLHYYEIGALPLAYIAVNKEEDMYIRKICNIPDSEVVCMFIGCGKVRETFSIATSVRSPIDSIINIID